MTDLYTSVSGAIDWVAKQPGNEGFSGTVMQEVKNNITQSLIGSTMSKAVINSVLKEVANSHDTDFFFYSDEYGPVTDRIYNTFLNILDTTTVAKREVTFMDIFSVLRDELQSDVSDEKLAKAAIRVVEMYRD